MYNPEVLLRRGNERIFAREQTYEQRGDVAYVVFPCAYTIGRDGDSINIYYGAADTSIALATSSIRQMLEWLEEHGK